MRARQIMTRDVITVTPQTTILDAARLMLRWHVSGLPVVEDGVLVGIVSQSDFLRRSEIGTPHRRPHWLQFLMGPEGLAADFVHEHGRKVEDVMTRGPVVVQEDAPLDELVHLMEKHDVHRLPVMRGKTLAGIVTRSNLLQAVAVIAGEIPAATAGDEIIRDRIIATIGATSWTPRPLQVAVRNGSVHLYGVVLDEESRRASVVAAENTAGVREVHDHLRFFDTITGLHEPSPEDRTAAARPR